MSITLKGTTVTIGRELRIVDNQGNDNPELVALCNTVHDEYEARRKRIKKAWKERKKANKAKQKDIWLKFDNGEG